MTDPQAVRRRPALVADLLLRAEVLVRVAVSGPVDRLLGAASGITPSVLGWPLTITRTPLSAFSTRKETFSETLVLLPPSYLHSTPALRQDSQ